MTSLGGGGCAARGRCHPCCSGASSGTRFKLKALLSFSPSKFETGCFQVRVELAPPNHEKHERPRAVAPAVGVVCRRERSLEILRATTTKEGAATPRRGHSAAVATLSNGRAQTPTHGDVSKGRAQTATRAQEAAMTTQLAPGNYISELFLIISDYFWGTRLLVFLSGAFIMG